MKDKLRRGQRGSKPSNTVKATPLVQNDVLQWLQEFLPKPTGTFKGTVELRGLININLASLLGVGLAEAFPSPIIGEPAYENASLAR